VRGEGVGGAGLCAPNDTSPGIRTGAPAPRPIGGAAGLDGGTKAR
jgi:hypothetical protein